MDNHQDPIGYINEEDNYSINKHIQKRIQKFKQLLSLNCLERGVSSYDIIDSNSIDIFKNIVIDKYFKGIGLLTNNNVFIRTIPFNLSSHLFFYHLLTLKINPGFGQYFTNLFI